MPVRKVYLGHVDIGLDSNLDLGSKYGGASDDDVLAYIFRYGLLADQVLMQGSAPLKSSKVLLAYIRLITAFCRNENHDPTPVFAFALSDESESYTEYIHSRMNTLDRIASIDVGNNNAERDAYTQNEAIDAAKQLDSNLGSFNIPRRKKSVSKFFRNGLLGLLNGKDIIFSGITLETADIAINKINESEDLQTFKLINSLGLRNLEQTQKIYIATRSIYRKANATGIEAMNSDDSPVWSPREIRRFLKAIGVDEILESNIQLTSEVLFKLRGMPSFKSLREEYFLCQSEDDINELVKILKELRLNGRVRSALQQSPGALSTLIFEALNDAKIGSKLFNKGAEQVAKIVLSNASDEYFGQRCYRLYGLVDQLKRDLCGLKPLSS
jgi:hypothetical protein